VLDAAREGTDAAVKGDMLLAESDLPATMADDSFSDEVGRMEAEVEAIQEVMQKEPSLEEVFERSKKDQEIERRLQELKKKFGK
jgi:hypothetical protein